MDCNSTPNIPGCTQEGLLLLARPVPGAPREASAMSSPLELALPSKNVESSRTPKVVADRAPFSLQTRVERSERPAGVGLLGHLSLAAGITLRSAWELATLVPKGKAGPCSHHLDPKSTQSLPATVAKVKEEEEEEEEFTNRTRARRDS